MRTLQWVSMMCLALLNTLGCRAYWYGVSLRCGRTLQLRHADERESKQNSRGRVELRAELLPVAAACAQECADVKVSLLLPPTIAYVYVARVKYGESEAVSHILAQPQSYAP